MGRPSIHIGNRVIDDRSPIFFIGEIGINHNGDLQLAKRLIDSAFACGWDCVKFQKRNPDVCVPEPQKGVMRDTPWGRMSYLDYRYRMEFGKEEYDYLDRYCAEKPILWSASAWDLDSLDFLLGYPLGLLKIPSAKLTDSALLEKSCRSGLPVLLSTGMSTLEEIDRAVEILEKHGDGNFILMHTNSAYPSPPEDINLRMIPFLRERYNCIVGYSGHETNLEPTVLAASLGVKVVERHITVSHDLWGSDHFASLEVHAMHMLINRCKDVDVLLGDGVKRLTGKELEVRRKLRGE